jgi:hypothetical protein
MTEANNSGAAPGWTEMGVERTKEQAFLIASALAAAAIAGSPLITIVIAGAGTNPTIPVLGVAWTRMWAGNDQLTGLPNSLGAAKFGVREMASQIVMDRTGDTRHIFDNQDRAEVTKAEQRFRELTGAGFTAAVRSGRGEQRIIRSFDPTAEETLFYPRLVGG